MKTKLKFTVALAALGIVTGAGAEDMYGVSFGNSTFSVIDSNTGTGSSGGDLGVAGWNSLESDGTSFYATTFSVSGVYNLYTWTLGNLTPSLVAATDDIRGLAYDGSTMWGIRNSTIDELVTYDVTTGIATLVGETGFNSIQALAVNGGALYGWDIFAGLISINSGSGIGTDVNGQVGGTGDIQGMDFDSSGNLLGARESFYSINTSTGVFTLVGSGGYADVRGLASGVVPEPATVTALILGGAMLLLRRRSM